MLASSALSFRSFLVSNAWNPTAVNSFRTIRRCLFPVPASQCGRGAVRIFDTLDQHVDAVAAPEQFAVEHHGGHAEHAKRLRFVNDAIVLGPRRSLDIGLKILCRAADRGDHAGDLRQVVDFEIMTPETAEYRVVIRAEQAVALREQHASAGIEGIIDAPRAL